uniref:Putative transcription factor bHLH103 n=1 Tax=Sisymbrium irio TaxID=3730 RepID=R9S9W6_SISIR|nr:putative transcription factor bHLH103 [Sisymbrium irio]
MKEEFKTTEDCTGTWWSLPEGMFSDCSLPRSTEISIDIGGFEWQNIDNLDANTYNNSHCSTLVSNTNLDSTSQIYVWNQYDHPEEERLDPINSFLKGLFDSSEQLSVPSVKPELLESFHFFDDVFLDESRTVSVFDHVIGDKREQDIQAWKSLLTCERAREKTEDLEDIESLPPLKRPRLETPSQFPSFKVRKEKLGDRITALQQLVSPFGKTDTASVLHDAIEYIKFLQTQISASSIPHLNCRGYGEQKQCLDKNTHDEDCSARQDLRSRGLCLMPISSTFSTSPPHLDTSSFWN